MRLSIREGTFETNSSSVHAIVINKKRMPEVTDSITQVRSGEYGWETEEYRTPYDKINYLWTAIVDNGKQDDGWKEYLIETLGLPEDTDFIIKDTSDPWYEPYIDHASELVDFLDDLKNDPDLLTRFIYGDAYVITGNDNDDTTPDILKDGDFYGKHLIEDDDLYIYGKWN